MVVRVNQMTQVRISGERSVLDSYQRSAVGILPVEAANTFRTFRSKNARSAVVALQTLAICSGDVGHVGWRQREYFLGGCRRRFEAGSRSYPNGAFSRDSFLFFRRRHQRRFGLDFSFQSRWWRFRCRFGWDRNVSERRRVGRFGWSFQSRFRAFSLGCAGGVGSGRVRDGA